MKVKYPCLNLLFCTYSIGIGGSDINHLADKDFLNFLKFRSPRKKPHEKGRELDKTWNIFFFIDSSVDIVENSTRNSLNLILAKT